MVCTLMLCYLFKLWTYVMSDMFAHSGALDMRTRTRPADWCARGKSVWSDGELALSSREKQTCL